MSLDFYLEERVFDANITHNLTKMAAEAGLYAPLWRPEDNGYYTASDLIEPLTIGLDKLIADPEKYKKFDSPNGWGMYDHFVPFVSKCLAACVAHPNARVRTSV